jgi:hypothetical protein
MMTDFSQYQHFATLHGADYYLVDDDIILIVPPKGYRDSPSLARASADFQDEYARKLGKKCALVIIMSNVLSQDAETRRVYNEQPLSGCYYGTALIVDNALSRAIASFLIGLTQTLVPVKLFDTVEHGVNWLRTIRPQ